MRLRVAVLMAVVPVAAAILGWSIASDRLAQTFVDRLKHETGRDWRVGAVRVAWPPALLVTDLATGDARAGLDIGRLTVPVSRALILGGAGTVPLHAEAVSLRIPVDGSPPGSTRVVAGPAHTEAYLDAIRVLSRDVACDVSRDGRRIDVTAGQVEIVLERNPNATSPSIDLDVENVGQRLHIALDRPGADAARPLRVDVTPSAGRSDLPVVRVRASLEAGADHVSIERIAGTLSESPVSGRLRLDLKGTTSLTGDLRLDDLILKAGVDEGQPVARGPRVSVPTDALPRPGWFAAFDADLRLAIGRVTLGPARFEDLAVVTSIRGGMLETAVTAARAYAGAMKLRYSLSPADGASTQDTARSDSETGRHRLSMTLAGARLRPLLTDLVGAGGLDAQTVARIDIQATAGRPADLARAATGFADVTLTDGRVDAADLIGLGGEGPFSRFQSLGGSFSIAEGRAVTNDLQLRSPLIQSTGAGSIDLVARTLDLHFQPAVTSQRGRSGSGRALNVPVHVSGPWDGPAVSADMGGLLQNPAGAIEALQDLGTGLMGPQGGGRGAGGFEGLLDAILPRGGREPAPVRRR